MNRQWDRWAEAWQRQEAPPEIAPRVERRVRRESRRQVVYASCEALVALGLLAYSGFRMWEDPAAPTLVWGAAIWILTFTAWAFSLWNRRGTWASPEKSLRSYLALSRERSRRDLRAVRFGVGLLAVEAAFVVAWYAWWITAGDGRAPGGGTLAAAGALLVLLCGALWVWLTHRRRRARDRLRWVERQEAEFADPDPSVGPAGGAGHPPPSSPDRGGARDDGPTA